MDNSRRESHNDYVDHGKEIQRRRIPIEVIGNRFLVLAFVIALLRLLFYFGAQGWIGL